MTEQETSGILAILTAQQWSFERDIQDPKALLQGWCLALEDLDLESVAEAVKTWIRNEKRFPAAAEIRSLVKPRGNGEVDWDQYRRFNALQKREQTGDWNDDLAGELLRLGRRLGIYSDYRVRETGSGLNMRAVAS